MAKIYDVLVVGAGPAGFTAAYAAARNGAEVLVLDVPGPQVHSPMLDWAPADLFDANAALKPFAEAAGAEPFKQVCYHSASLDRCVDNKARGRMGFFFDVAALSKALSAAARKAGATVRLCDSYPAIQPGDDAVTIRCTTKVTGRLAIISRGNVSDLAGSLGLPMRAAHRPQMTIAALEIPLRAAQVEALAGSLHMVELTERSELGMFFVHRKMLHLRIISNSAAAGNRAAEISSLLGAMQKSSLLKGELTLEKARGAVWEPPSGLALELETHLAKRTILTGPAGGFSDSTTGQVLAPSMEAALLAGETAVRALRNDHPAAALAEYQQQWQDKIGDNLRPPATPPQLLLPLLLVNSRIAPKFTEAILYGRAF